MHWAVLVDLARSPPAPLCSWVWRPLLLLLFAHGFGPSPPAPLCSWIWPPLLLLLFARGFGPSPPAPLCSWVWPLSSCSSLLVGLAPLLLLLFARGFGPSPPVPLCSWVWPLSSCSSSRAQDRLYQLKSTFNFYVNVVTTNEAKSC